MIDPASPDLKLFLAALELPPDLRGAFLGRNCADDPALLARIDYLLRHYEQDDGFLAAPLLAREGAQLEQDGRWIGRRLGAYVLEEWLGAGGTSVVFRARRTDDAPQQVAIKVLRHAGQGGALFRRFDVELRALASLEHPSIARFLDCGFTDEAVPYLVMELVRGTPVTEYCDLERLAVDQRLAIFDSICGAVEHAHRRLVIHRDLKPSNILITEEGTPKLLDFGIAKLLSDDHPPATLETTAPEHRALTIGYASPEHLAGETVTTASDVYSLAVLLYELLTGSRPFDWSRHSVQGVAAAVRRLPVPLPSTVVASSPSRRPASDEGGIECPADLAAKRSTTRRALRKRLAGDLDAVLLRGLRADVQERYGSVEELREDLSRHRLGLPVLARRATVAYRLGRFLQRHATAAVVAVVLVVLVMGFSAFTFVQSRELRRQRDRAATAIDFLVTSLADADPWRGGTTELTARQMLASAVRRARSELGTQPVLRAEVLKSVGVVYEGLGAYAEAEEVAGEALVLLRGDKDKRRENVAELLELLAKTHAGRGDHAAAEGLAREGLFILESVGGDSIAIARAQTVLAGMVAESGRYDEAERLVLSAADRLRAANGAATAQAAATLRVLAGVRLARGDSRAAEEAISEALRLHREIHGEVHAEVAGDIAMLAEILVIRGDWARALVPAREAFELHRDIFDRGHPQTQSSRSRLGIVLMFLGEHEESEALLREALDLERESPPADPLSTAHHLDNLASVLEPQGAYLEARELRRQALGIARSRLGSDHPDLAVVLNNLASNLIYTQDYDEAESLLRESLAIRRRNTPHHLDVATVLFNLGNLLKVNGGLDEAEEMYRQGLEMRRELAGAGSVYVAQSLEALGDLYIGSDRAEEGLELALEARQIYAASYPEDHWRHAFVRALEGAALARLERFEESERLLLDSLRDLERSLGPDAYETRAVDRRIERLYELWERPHREGAGGGSSSRGGSRAAPSR